MICILDPEIWKYRLGSTRVCTGTTRPVVRMDTRNCRMQVPIRVPRSRFNTGYPGTTSSTSSTRVPEVLRPRLTT
eukprot:855686-Rhodomonas_salina.1